jgi:hypothetical protein
VADGANWTGVGEADVRRIKASQKWFDRYVLQYIYIPVVYALLGVKTRSVGGGGWGLHVGAACVLNVGGARPAYKMS